MNKKPCFTCHGTGALLCNRCNGTKEQECQKCKGSGHINYGPVRGLNSPAFGKAKTTLFEGWGLHGSGECNRCKGYGKHECSKCKGSGIVECLKCGGTGTFISIKQETYHTQNENRVYGTVKFYNKEKGFGFLIQENTNIEIHVSVKNLNGIPDLQVGNKVSFVCKEGTKGKWAASVIRIS